METDENKTVLATMRIADLSDASIFQYLFYTTDDIAFPLHSGEHFYIQESHRTFKPIKEYIKVGSEVRKLTIITYHKVPGSDKLKWWQMFYRFEQEGADLIKAIHITEYLLDPSKAASEDAVDKSEDSRPKID